MCSLSMLHAGNADQMTRSVRLVGKLNFAWLNKAAAGCCAVSAVLSRSQLCQTKVPLLMYPPYCDGADVSFGEIRAATLVPALSMWNRVRAPTQTRSVAGQKHGILSSMASKGLRCIMAGWAASLHPLQVTDSVKGRMRKAQPGHGNN